ncbi:MAG: hypothetical protein LBD10_14600 [Desulfobulbus sp.]|uniref:hypothetical protein n=1 Tax=Desulfobulbus sp. TaxID=895 RepID=UPI00283DC6A8|nr:hypothetical protein [Desulfobulbus sp.]MDR2551418.1 hypothetical protein [Desulfobulbus sp.]
MNYTNLAQAVRRRANTINTNADYDSVDYDTQKDDAELLRCLARIISGRSVKEAFGSPGDWGYGTPIGDALREDYAAAGAAGGQRVAPADVERVG